MAMTLAAVDRQAAGRSAMETLCLTRRMLSATLSRTSRERGPARAPARRAAVVSLSMRSLLVGGKEFLQHVEIMRLKPAG